MRHRPNVMAVYALTANWSRYGGLMRLAGFSGARFSDKMDMATRRVCVCFVDFVASGWRASSRAGCQ